ncbi:MULTISPECIES: hypothetical protein [unclassified Haladaptatus]|uniref:hypothetical protein n=1 Tax=unclassified Haladaptatus TaxID=2622732 RepID=UPI0023E818B6|nr:MULTISPECIES: hypothetical protein [unclassified Haladaptatus]
MTQLRDYLPGVGEPIVRRRLDEIFSRQLLGAVLVGAGAAKIVEKVINIVLGPSDVRQLVGWTVMFFLAIALFVWWERVAKAANSAAERVGDATGVTGDEQVAEEAFDTAVRAEETAADALEVAQESTLEAAKAITKADEAAARATELEELANAANQKADEAAVDASEAKRAAKKAIREAEKATEATDESPEASDAAEKN